VSLEIGSIFLAFSSWNSLQDRESCVSFKIGNSFGSSDLFLVGNHRSFRYKMVKNADPTLQMEVHQYLVTGRRLPTPDH